MKYLKCTIVQYSYRCYRRQDLRSKPGKVNIERYLISQENEQGINGNFNSRRIFSRSLIWTLAIISIACDVHLFKGHLSIFPEAYEGKYESPQPRLWTLFNRYWQVQNYNLIKINRVLYVTPSIDQGNECVFRTQQMIFSVKSVTGACHSLDHHWSRTRLVPWHVVKVTATLLKTTLIARFMGPTWGPSGEDRSQVQGWGEYWTYEYEY